MEKTIYVPGVYVDKETGKRNVPAQFNLDMLDFDLLAFWAQRYAPLIWAALDLIF